MTNGPLIVQSDKTLLLDIDHPDSVECRRAIRPEFGLTLGCQFLATLFLFVLFLHGLSNFAGPVLLGDIKIKIIINNPNVLN